MSTTTAPAAPVAPATITPPPVETPFRRFVAEFAASSIAVGALVVFAVIALVAILAPWIAPQNPYDLAVLDIMDGRLEPGSVGGTGIVHWLGTDDQGRDMLSGIMYGLRISLTVGAGSALIACVVGAALGMLAAYAGGRTDSAIMRLVDLQLSFPAILAALMILAFLGKGILNVVIAIVVVEWAYYARTVRGTALVERRRSTSRRRSASPCRPAASSSATCCPTACRR
jgi:peptide/nickel transport system permease protein